MHFELTPVTPNEDNLTVTVDIHGRGEFCFIEFAVRGDRTDIEIQEMCDEIERKGDLTSRSRFELFACDREGTAYTEYVFGLNNQWNCFSYDDYKTGKTQPEQETPDIVIMPALKVFRLSAMISWSLLNNRLCGLAVVLKSTDGKESVWNIANAPKGDDIHNSENFTAEFKSDSVVVSDESNDQRLKGIVKAMRANGDLREADEIGPVPE